MNSKAVYRSIIKEMIVSPTSETFFKNNFDFASENFEQIYCIPFNVTIFTKLRSSQFKINHNNLCTNYKLHKVKLSDTQMCTFCNDEIETLLHIFIECNEVVNISQKVIANLLQPFRVSSLTKKENCSFC